jgi:hypothetical protein
MRGAVTPVPHTSLGHDVSLNTEITLFYFALLCFALFYFTLLLQVAQSIIIIIIIIIITIHYSNARENVTGTNNSNILAFHISYNILVGL